MTVFSGKQVVPMDYEAEVSQRLLEDKFLRSFKPFYYFIKAIGFRFQRSLSKGSWIT
ncbi:hypothetical protein AALP_AA6G336500 [Arabis alpina]|uniref:Uncharacterized protein n=1 Tax=Arabis alpina TaxID=50452 RepID=A0A087GTE0_ARAAL|nr:hypothetical protein AALP_AA6G336500 [Arabis alpina]